MNEKMNSATVVLVTDQFACERIIKASRLVADLNHTNLVVLSVMRNGAETNPAALEHLFGVAKEYGAQMTLEFSDSVESTIVHFTRENRVVCAVTGIPENEHSILVRLWQRLTNVAFYTVSSKGALREVFGESYFQKSAAAGRALNIGSYSNDDFMEAEE